MYRWLMTKFKLGTAGASLAAQRNFRLRGDAGVDHAHVR